MPDTSWALLHDEGRPDDTVASLVVAQSLADPSDPALRTLLEQWGAFVRSLAPERAFGATADNVAVLDATLRLASDLREAVTPLDADATRARLCWHLARSVVVAGAADDPTMRVDELAARLGAIAGLAYPDPALARALAHEASTQARLDDLDAEALGATYAVESAWDSHAALDAGALDTGAQRRALHGAWRSLVRTRRDRDRAETEAIGHAAARALATDLGEVLERDEWIRARLRNVKSTRPARLLIAARKKALGRPA